MAEYARTSIKRLKVHGYRSLRALDLEDLPPLIMLYGPNGSGKSNILKAAQLLLRAAAQFIPAPSTREAAAILTLAEANEKLDLRLDDFSRGQIPEIRISLEIGLGAKARAILSAPDEMPLDSLFLEGFFQDTGGKTIRFWLERADIDGRIALVPIRKMSQGAKSVIDVDVDEILRYVEIGDISHLMPRIDQVPLMAERTQRALIPKLMQASGAYRAPRGSEDPSEALYAAALSEDPMERQAALGLGRRLAEAGLFGRVSVPVEMIPVEAKSFGERQIQYKHPNHGFLPLRNLGTGEQQLVMMLGQQVITPFPIALLEEPEAHLHKTLMEPLARVLKASVAGNSGAPDVDQLWIATHHHYFALADDFFDVHLDQSGTTKVEKKRRDAAAMHFYEPSPYWDTLELLVKNGMSPHTVVYRSPDGHPATASEVLASIRGDQVLANKFVEAATKAFVLSLSEEEPAT